MSESGKAVFLSYASQDAEAARRICETLRSSGVEVWFDADGGLEHGDEWDAKIRRQIKECVLFIPIISANTQAREEGYFRLEWDLAAERARNIASGVPFILPVVIDDTREPDALVPDRFRAVQWTKLRGGEVPPEVQQRFLKLWSHRTGVLQHGAGAGRGHPTPPSGELRAEAAESGDPTVRRNANRRLPAAAWAALAVVAVAAIVFFSKRNWDRLRGQPEFEALLVPPEKETAAAPAAPAPKSAPADKSVAVLPFVNGSGDKENEFFSDGISEELITALQKIPGLKVPASTSSFHFKGKNTPIAEIARQLNVAYVIEGNVRKVGGQVRITAKLVKAADGFPVWSSGNLNRELKDVLAVQEEIAGLIAQALQLKLGATAAPAPVNPEAYQHLLQARFFSRSQDNAGWRKAIEECRAALAIDANYAPAAAEMARSYIFLCRFGGIPLAEGFQAARPAAERAIALNPGSPEANNALAWVRRTADWDWHRADASFRRAYELAPRSAEMIRDYAVIRNNLGFLTEAVDLGRRAVELDPLNASAHSYQALFLAWAGRLDEAVVEMKRGLELAPTGTEWHSYLARFLTMLGRFDEAAAAAEAEPNESYRLFSRGLVLLGRKDRPAADRVIQELVEKHGETMNIYVAELFAFAGDADRAFEWLERGRVRRETATAWIRAWPVFRPLHADPRWGALLRKVGLPEEPLK